MEETTCPYLDVSNILMREIKGNLRRPALPAGDRDGKGLQQKAVPKLRLERSPGNHETTVEEEEWYRPRGQTKVADGWIAVWQQ